MIAARLIFDASVITHCSSQNNEFLRACHVIDPWQSSIHSRRLACRDFRNPARVQRYSRNESGGNGILARPLGPLLCLFRTLYDIHRVVRRAAWKAAQPSVATQNHQSIEDPGRGWLERISQRPHYTILIFVTHLHE